MALTNFPTQPNINENWLFNFTADNTNCLEFDGTDDYVAFGDVLGLYRSFTLEAWIKTDDYDGSSGTQVIVERGNDGSTEAKNTNWQMALRHNGLRCKYQYGTGSNVANTITTSAITVNNWHHVAVMRDNTDQEMRFYVDGVEIGTSTVNTSNDPSGGGSGIVNIGANFEQDGDFDGEIAHVRVWNYARSAAQIAYSYNRLVDSTSLGLVAYWKLNEGHGTSVADYSTNSNSGTVTNATWSLNGFDEIINAFNLSFKNTIVDNITYHGTILNKGIVVRESIDITKGTSATGNITLNSANIDLFGTDLYKILFNGTNEYLNKEVHVYAQFNNESSLANCQRIFTGRIVDIKLDQNQVITMQINSHRPWDKVQIPNEKTDISNVYVPIVYGSYSPNTTTLGSPTLVGNQLYPAPVLNTTNVFITTLMPRSYSSSSNAFLNKWFGNNTFLPARTGSSPYNVNETTEIYQGQNCIQTKLNKYWSGITKANEDDANTSNQLFTNIENAFDENDNTFATSTLSSGNSSTTLAIGLGEKKYHAQLYRRIHVFVKNSESEVVNVSATIGDGNYHTEEVETTQQTFSDSSTVYEVVIDHRANNLPTSLSCQITFQHSSGTYGTLSVQKIHVEMSALAYGSTESDSGEKRIHMDNDAKSVTAIKYLYSGGAGLTESWSGGNTAIAWGIEAFRDMMIRFAGHHKTAPTGWTSLYYDRRTNASGVDQDNWKIRYWQLEPVNLKDKLDQLAYEFGFVYKFAADGTLKVIHVLQSSELSATLDLSGYDLNNINVSTTGLSEIITKMTINNKLHPAESNRYESDVTNINTTTRTKYNQGEKENIANINLDMNVGDIPTTANNDCNADFYSYYDNIVGDIKVIVSCDIVNMTKGAQLETGDIVTFSSMPVEMFGDNFAANRYFMIIETKRSLGKVSVIAREVG